LKTSQHVINLQYENVTVSTHTIYIYIFVVIAAKHLPASTMCCSRKLVVGRMVGYHCMILILQYFEVYPHLNEVVSINPNLIWAAAIYPNVYNICKSEWISSTLPRSFQ